MNKNTYTNEFRKIAVSRVKKGEAISEVAEDLKIPRGTLATWVVRETPMVRETKPKLPTTSKDFENFKNALLTFIINYK